MIVKISIRYLVLIFLLKVSAKLQMCEIGGGRIENRKRES